MNPAETPPAIIVLKLAFGRMRSERDCSLLFRVTKSSGTRERHPSAKRIPLKVNGPTYSIPTRWATKANPQSVAVKSSSASDLTVFVRNGFLRPHEHIFHLARLVYDKSLRHRKVTNRKPSVKKLRSKVFLCKPPFAGYSFLDTASFVV